MSESHSKRYLQETAAIAAALDPLEVEALVHELWLLRERAGRLFIAGLGGSAANASHAAADFRKLARIDACSLSDSVADITARANDEGWGEMYAGALAFAAPGDALLILSVGGGADGVSLPLIGALGAAREKGMKVLGIVGRDGGATKRNGDCVIVIPTVEPTMVTPHTEAFQVVLIHCLVSHSALQRVKTKW